MKVFGIGWIADNAHGSLGLGLKSDVLPVPKEVFTRTFKNLGRLNNASRLTCLAVGLALRDAGLSYPPPDSVEIGIAGADTHGCLDADMDYFRDYIEGGRKLGRGNLFIYTLPTSTFAEAAIHFGLKGPLLYSSGTGGTGSPLFEAVSVASRLIQEGGADLMLAGYSEGKESIYMVLGKKGSCVRDPLFGLGRAEPALGACTGIADTIAGLRDLTIELKEV